MIALFLLLFLQIFFLLILACLFFVFSFLTNWKISLFTFISIFRSRHWELFCQTAVWQDRTKISNFFFSKQYSFQYSILNKKVYRYIKSEILCRYSFRVMVIKFILQCNWTTTFLLHLWMAALIIYLINKCNPKIRHINNQIITHHIIFRRNI